MNQAGLREFDKESPICSYIPPFRPDWNIENVWKSIHDYKLNSVSFQKDEDTEMVIVIRAHTGYGYLLISMLASMKSVVNVRLRVIVACTESRSYSGLRIILRHHMFIDDNGMAHSPGVWSGLRISLLDVPKEIFTKYGSHVQTMCTEPAKRLFTKIGYGPYEISRFCEVNSPLHYLLVDAVLHYIQKYCINCRLVMITNADNTYHPSIYKDMITRSENADVILTNTVNYGGILRVEAKAGYVDLGSFSTSVPFLRKTGLTFIGSVPRRPLANDYHNADGLFVDKLKAHNARFSIIESFLFNHNR